MIVAVIPAKNEAENIRGTLNNLRNLPIDRIIPVLNGCTDDTKGVILNHPLNRKVLLLEYANPLGVDVPRVLGAKKAYEIGARAVLFLDGDMQGDLTIPLFKLIKAVVNEECDLALTNCYPYIGYRSAVAQKVLSYREQLNRTLNVFTKLGLATPSHGPHCVSKRLLETIDIDSLAIPPLAMAMAVEKRLNIRVATCLNDDQWASAQRGDKHNQLIADTIIGDCIQAMQYHLKQPMDRSADGQVYLGYHPWRHFPP